VTSTGNLTTPAERPTGLCQNQRRRQRWTSPGNITRGGNNAFGILPIDGCAVTVNSDGNITNRAAKRRVRRQ